VLLGCTPKQYLIRVRTELGLGLVEQGLKVADAAERAGFSDSSKFIHACHRVVGCTPLEYMRANGLKPGRATSTSRAEKGLDQDP
jgi:AraC-like DNA-binding protein